MSYEIEYRHLAFAYDGQRAHAAFNALAMERTGQTAYYSDYAALPCAVTFVESGSNNTHDTIKNRRARSWQLEHCGERHNCMRRVIEAAVYVEEGLTQPNNRYQKAEAYIAAARQRLAAARPLEVLFEEIRGSTLELSIHDFDEAKAGSHPWWLHAVDKGWTHKSQYSKGAVRLPLHDQLELECLLQTLPSICTGCCGTYGTPGYGGYLRDSLDRLHGGRQLQLIA